MENKDKNCPPVFFESNSKNIKKEDVNGEIESFIKTQSSSRTKIEKMESGGFKVIFPGATMNLNDGTEALVGNTVF